MGGEVEGAILRRRLQAQRISTAAFARPEQVVAWLGAVQAQDYLGALWGIGLRTLDAREPDVEEAITQRRIVRTWPMRGTLHLVAANDVRWMTELLAPRAAAAAASRMAGFEIDARVLSRARRVLVRNLEGGKHLTRPAAYRVLETAGIATGASRGLHVLWRLAHDGLVCFGPRAGKQHTFVLLDEWLPDAPRLPREEALARLAVRYFTSHGPATLADFAWWSGLKAADARIAVELAAGSLDAATLGGVRHWSATAPAPAVRPGSLAYALPAFDEFLVGYADRSAAAGESEWARVTAGGIFSPVLVVEGRVVGTWKRRIRPRGVSLSSAPFGTLGERRARAVERAFRRYGRFLGLPIVT